MEIKPGHGYWDTTFYPIGGKFGRAPRDSGLPVQAVNKLEEPYRGCTHSAVTADGRNVAFNIQHTQESETV